MSQEKAAEIIDLNASRESADAAQADTSGELLAQTRHTAGLSLAAVSDATKVKIEHLEAIEACDASVLPATPYAIGFVKVYAKFLNLDADALAERFKKDIGAGALEPQEMAIEESVAAPDHGGSARMGSIIGVIAVLIFVIWIAVQISGASDKADRSRTPAEPERRVSLGAELPPPPSPRPRVSTEETTTADADETIEEEIAPPATTPAPAPAETFPTETSVEPQPIERAPQGQDEVAAPLLEPEISALAIEDNNEAAGASEALIDAPVETLPPAPLIVTEPVIPEPVIVDARLTRSIAPRYPDRCTRNAQELETVTVRFDVTVAGRAANLSVIDSSNACFNDAAVSTIRRWRFNAKTVDGAPRPDLGKQATLNFRQ